MMESLEQYLRHHAETMPGKIAVQAHDAAITYRQLWNDVTAEAEAISRDPRRAIVLKADRGWRFIGSYLATHLAGKVVVPVEKDIPDDKFKAIDKLVNTVGMDARVSDVLFTTGTTGKQKGTMISQQVILADADNLINAQGFSPELLFIITGPLNHIGSLSKIWPSIIVGATIYVMDGIKDPDAFFSVIENSPVKVATFQVPASLRILLQLGHDRLAALAHKIDFIETGAAPISQSDMEAMCRLLPDTRLYNTYASTETGIIATHNFNDGHCVAGCLGTVMKNSVLEINPDGFIECAGPTVMLGYCGDPEETARILIDGRIVTRDKGTIDDCGRLQLSGRDDDVINVGGFKVNPIEVEDVAMDIPAIADCICIAAPHPVLGWALRLLYQVENGCQLDNKSIARHMASKLERYKVPHLYTRVDKINRTYNGKLDRKSYRE